MSPERVDNVRVRQDMDVPHPHVLGADFSVFIVKISQENHLQKMVDQALDHDRPQAIIFSLQYELVEDAKTNVNLEEDCDKSPPI